LIRCEEEREARAAVVAERDQLAVEHEPAREGGELRDELCHTPAAAAADLEPVFGATSARKPSHFTS
jgi:hypothetical protein